ncbi:MMPL family transporter [Nocardia sp. NPDC055029]
MSVYLYRWGKFAFRRKWIVIPVWLALLALAVGLGASVSKPFQDEFSLPGLPSDRATEILDEHFPGMSKEIDPTAVAGTYVIGAPEGEKLTDPHNAAAVQAFVAKLGVLDIVDRSRPLVDPITATTLIGQPAGIDCLTGDRNDAQFVAVCNSAPLNVLNRASPDSVATIKVKYDIAEMSDVTEEDRHKAYDVADDARAAGLEVYLTGIIATEPEEGGAAELIGIAVALVVMAVAFGAIVAAFVPVVTALLGLGGAFAVILFGSAWLTLPTFTPVLASMIGLALSIDYALFIVSRYKHELSVAESPEEAAGTAMGTAGSSVIFAGLTVIIALAALSVVRIDFLTYMGVFAAVSAAFAVLVAVTLLPAMLGALGRRLFTPKLPLVAKYDPEDDTAVTAGMRFARTIGKSPALALAAGVVLLGMLTVPAADMQLGLPGGDSFPEGTQLREAYELQTKGFGEGANGTLMVVVDLTDVPQNQRQSAVDDLRNRLASNPGMNYLTPSVPSADGQATLFMGVPKAGPNDDATRDLVETARDAEPELENMYGMKYGVTGTTAVYIDVSDALLSKIVPYMALVAGAAFILLVLVFRSILVPLTAALGFLLSMGATFGATVLIFQKGTFDLVEPHPLVSFLPIILIGLVFGLAMDYQVFLVTRMREEFIHGKSPKEAMITGYHHGARVVTSAAIIMISVFSAFMLNDNVVAQCMGFALAAGVFFDAFVVRMVIVPALLVLMGRAAWWFPKWLDRIVPDIDVEGAKLTHRRTETTLQPVGSDTDPVTVR